VRGRGGFACVVGLLDAADVGDGFAIGWNGFIEFDALRTGIVSGEGEREIVVVAVKKFAEIFCAGFDIFLRIKNIFHAEAGGGLRKKLHEAAGVFAGDGFGVEFRFGGDDADDEVSVHAMMLRRRLNKVGVRNIGERGAGPERRTKKLFRLDGDDFAGGKFGGAAGHGEFVGVADELVAGDENALSALEDDVFGAGGLREYSDESTEQRACAENFART